MVELLVLTVMTVVVCAHWRAGLLSALLLLVNVTLAGLLAFNFWEPLARALGRLSPRVEPYADALWLTALLLLFLVLLRLATGALAPRPLVLPVRVQRSGCVLVSALTGYLLSGILLCLVQTLPLPVRCLDYDHAGGAGLGAPERLWLAIVHRASGVVFDFPGTSERWFDADGSFHARYARYRRISPGQTGPLVNQGEFPQLLSADRAIESERQEAK